MLLMPVLDFQIVFGQNFAHTKYPQRDDDTIILDQRDPPWHTTQDILRTFFLQLILSFLQKIISFILHIFVNILVRVNSVLP